MAEENAFEILGKIGVDNVALLKELRESERIAQKSADNLAAIWEKAKASVTPKRAAGAGESSIPAGTVFTGGAAGNVSASVFSKQGQQIATAVELARAAAEKSRRSLDDANEAAHKYNISVRDAAGSVRLLGISVLSELNPALGQGASIALNVARNMKDLGVGFAAGSAAAGVLALAIGMYIAKVKEGLDAQVALNNALRNSDYASAAAQAQKASDAIGEFNTNAQVAGQQEIFTGEFAGTVRSSTEIIISYWNSAGKTADALTEKMTRAALASAKIFRETEAPKMRLRADVEAAKASRDQIALDKDAATSADDLSGANARLTAVIRAQADAEAKLIETEKDAIESKRKLGSMTNDEADARVADVDRRAKLVRDQGAREETRNARAGAREQAQLEAERETFVQQEIARNQQRVQSVASTAAAILDAERSVMDLRRQQIGAVESSVDLEKRLSVARVAATAPLVASIEAATSKYESQKRALQGLIAAGQDTIKNQLSLAELEKSSVEEVADLRRRLVAETARLEAQAAQEREQRAQREISLEEKALAHRVATGRATAQEEMSALRLATADPRRSLEQQEAAERQLTEKRKQYADEYFKYYQSLGRSTWQDQLQAAESFLSQTVEGSQQWFSAVQKVSDVYKGINDQAKSILSQQVSIAEQEARRSGRTKIGVGDIGGLVQRARQRDARALSGSRVDIGDLSSALNRRDLFKTMDREGLSPGAAFGRAMQDPQQQLAETLSRVSTSIEQSSMTAKSTADGVVGLGDAARVATAALLALASAASGRESFDVRPDTGESRAPRVLDSAGGRSFSNMPDLDEKLGWNLLHASERGVAQ